MKKELINQAVKDWAAQSVTIKEVERHLITWQDLSYALEIARSIDYQLVDSFVSELTSP